ncbi:redoxin domain-containing protein [Mangrovibacterium diazotrophicum]|uniref:Thioredoxin peroxidase n=1 Tax=Mangrovibacterium diazotrophicum TaxID=1261403 RepID=A0A419VWG3_9BACT|nr:redoxin domain-containing protein [Mangrovibacterium diazotrophicum]RKD86499.1 peroxiredoxin (alkyl hydroperoxide reductase subunit C) [Mangrovibacterium diazotrophicum]
MKKISVSLLMSFFLVTLALAQKDQIPLIGSKAPSFTAQTTQGELTFPDDFGSSWKILFSHPKDFTPVCSSELLELAYMQKELEAMNVKVAVISTDNLSQHQMWVAHLQELDYKNRGQQEISFPLIDDSKMIVSKTYGMLHSPTSSSRDIRGVYIIDSNNIVRSINFYPVEVGRNMVEIERIVSALQTTEQEMVLTPANWKEGDDVMVPYLPYRESQLAENPELKDEFYNVGNRMWFKKVGDK